jgi:hypothetical protein
MSNDETDMTNLPAIADDGFADDSGDDELVIKGTIARCVDGVWTAKDGSDLPERLFALSTAQALQRWYDNKPIKTLIKMPGKPLPDIDALNAAIPKDEWEKDDDDEPRKPWVRQFIVYLLDPKDASVYTFINSTVGASIAVDRLKERVKWMRALRGSNVVPIVELGAKPMKTKHGTKQRPEFIIHDWRELGGGQQLDAQQVKAPPAIEHVGEPVEQPTTEEVLNDELPPWNDSPEILDVPAGKADKPVINKKGVQKIR